MSATLNALENSNISISPELSTSAQEKNCAVVVPRPHSHSVNFTRSSSKLLGIRQPHHYAILLKLRLLLNRFAPSSSDSPITSIVSRPTPRPNSARIVVVPSTRLYADMSLVLKQR